jgi:ATP-binding cassette subfamily G (WHITE) protein 1/ATP-binding cassette subfamily G (WHITE) protein 2
MANLASTGGQFFFALLVYFLMTFNGASIGLLLGSVISDPKSITTGVSSFYNFCLVISGLFVNTDYLPKWFSWLQYLSPIKYAFSAFVNNEVAYRESNIY